MATLNSEAATFALEPLRCDEALDLGSFGVWLLALAFWLHFAADDEFTDLYLILIVSIGFFMVVKFQKRG